VLHSRIAAIHRAHRFFMRKFYNTGKNAVENGSANGSGGIANLHPQGGLAHLYCRSNTKMFGSSRPAACMVMVNVLRSEESVIC